MTIVFQADIVFGGAPSAMTVARIEIVREDAGSWRAHTKDLWPGYHARGTSLDDVCANLRLAVDKGRKQ